MKVVATIFFLITSWAAIADQRINLPGGGGCWVNDAGFTYGCSGTSQTSHPAATTAREAREAERLRSEKLEKCLRTSDWPNMPGRSECIEMYGAKD